MVERLLLLRPDILGQTIGILHMMPYIRSNSFYLRQKKLELAAANSEPIIKMARWVMTLFKNLPQEFVETMNQYTFEDKDGLHLAVQLLRQPNFAGNFPWLGSEEIRDVPEVVDVRYMCVCVCVCVGG